MSNGHNAQVAAANQAAVILSVSDAETFLVETMLTSLNRGLPLHPIEVLGKPGIGKTAVAKSAAEKIRKDIPNFGIEVLAPSTTPSDELAGIPLFDKREDTGETILHYALPYWVTTQEMDPNYKAFWVFDDARQCQGDQQKVLANLIYERTMRGKRIPDGVQFILTGNRMEDRAGVVKELTHYSGRKTTIHAEASLDEWRMWAINHGVMDEIIGYVSWKQDQFCNFDPNREKNPTPRTWVACSDWEKIVSASPTLNRSRGKFLMSAWAGEVGPGAASECHTFCELFRSMPDLDAIIANPSGANIPDKADMQYAVTVALANRIDSKTFGAVLEYITRVGVEHAALSIQLALPKHPTITSHKAFGDWVRTYKRSIFGAHN